MNLAMMGLLSRIGIRKDEPFETELSYEFPTHFDYVAKGALYCAVITSVKNYGSASFYGPEPEIHPMSSFHSLTTQCMDSSYLAD